MAQRLDAGTPGFAAALTERADGALDPAWAGAWLAAAAAADEAIEAELAGLKEATEPMASGPSGPTINVSTIPMLIHPSSASTTGIATRSMGRSSALTSRTLSDWRFT